jgi:hypothetical protein
MSELMLVGAKHTLVLDLTEEEYLDLQAAAQEHGVFIGDMVKRAALDAAYA